MMTWSELLKVRSLTPEEAKRAFYFLWGMLEGGGFDSYMIDRALRHAIHPEPLEKAMKEAADGEPQA